MLDLQALAHDPETLLARLARRGLGAEITAALSDAAARRRAAIAEVDGLRQQLNAHSATLATAARAGSPEAIEQVRGALRDLKAAIKLAEEAQGQADAALSELVLLVPNPPDPAVPDGAGEAGNVVLRRWGAPSSPAFEPLPHWTLGEQLGIISFAEGAKLSGARFAVLRGAGARLERALTAYMVDLALAHGYEEIAPPLLVRRGAMQAAGQYPKFIGESFEVSDGEHVLIPTSEVPLVGLHRDEILPEAALPRRYTAATPCFRREAGAAGKDTRGLIRLHQFHKVELVALTTPEEGPAELERITGHAEAVLRGLGLPYRVMALCAGDLGFAACRTYDLEVWLPGQAAYREISSCSWCGDFQARRAMIRYRPEAGGGRAKPRLVHTLNGSALAVGRCMVALLENYQQADGSIALPQALHRYFGDDRIVRAG